MLGLPGTWQTGRSGFHLNHLRASCWNVDHPGAEYPRRRHSPFSHLQSAMVADISSDMR
jgi:hypothetical protein